MATLPSDLSLTTIGGVISAAPHVNNYTAIQTGFNAVNDILAGGSSGQVLQSGGGTTVSWATDTSGAGYGTALPGSPTEGQEYVLVDSAAAPTYQWRFRYVSAKASNKWVYIGGAPGFAEVTTSQSSTSTSYTDLATTGPALVVPVAGDYLVGIGMHAGGAVAQVNMSYAIGASVAADVDATYCVPGGGTPVPTSRKMKKALTAVTLTAKYKASTGSSQLYERRWMELTPIAIGG